MCDVTSAIMLAASTGLAAKSAHDQNKAAKEAQRVQEETARKQEEALRRKGPDATTSVSTTAADDEKRRRLAVLNRTNVLTGRRGVLGLANTDATALNAPRTTLG